MKIYYRGNLPHLQPVGSAFFVTFRLFGSIPFDKIYELKVNYSNRLQEIYKIPEVQLKNQLLLNVREEYFEKFDEVLQKVKKGPHFFSDPDVIKIVEAELKKHDGDLYELIAYCIMSNHVHIVIDTEIQLFYTDDWLQLEKTYKPLDKILKQIKGATARNINLYLKRTGQLWERESYDVYIKNEKMLNNVIAYTLNNPVKAGIVSRWEDFIGNYFVEKE
jgi:putative transposase